MHRPVPLTAADHGAQAARDGGASAGGADAQARVLGQQAGVVAEEEGAAQGVGSEGVRRRLAAGDAGGGGAGCGGRALGRLGLAPCAACAPASIHDLSRAEGGG